VEGQAEQAVFLAKDSFLDEDVAVDGLHNTNDSGWLKVAGCIESRAIVKEKEIGAGGGFPGEVVDPDFALVGQFLADGGGQAEPHAGEIEILQVIGPKQFSPDLGQR
jgi:hypothetical protein